MLISIVINNYNYARYLASAIESALAQTWNETEVIVVDDGSTDTSREVAARYAGRVKVLLKANGGQASAFNAGFASARGDVVLFLDADDMLKETTAMQVAETFRQDPGTAKVQWRLQFINAQGSAMPAFTPPAHVPLPHGNLLPRLLQYPDDIPHPPTSGNAYASRVLKKILPMPEPEYRLCADYYLLNLAPLYGPVLSLEGIGGYYRVHGENGQYGNALNLDRVRQIIQRTQRTHLYLLRAVEALGVAGGSENAIEGESVTLLAHRLVSYKLARQKHPVAGDTLSRLALLGVRSSFHSPELARFRRLMWALWFLLVAAAPIPMSQWLATFFYHHPLDAAR